LVRENQMRKQKNDGMTIRKDRPYSPHIKLLKYSVVYDHIKKYRLSNKGKEISFIDVGGRRGELHKHARGFKYTILEIDKKCKKIPHVIIGDICNCPEIKNGSYDIVFSNDVFEHIEAPWLAADECIRICKKGGLLIHIAPFSARYHPVPVDTFRYSHYGFKCLFERYGNVKTVLAGYDISHRRCNGVGGKVKGYLDAPPLDSMGGWRESWKTIYIGYKTK